MEAKDCPGLNRNGLKWPIQKYARYMGNTELNTNKAQDWKIFVGTKDKPMQLLLTESNHVLVTYDQQILENHSLWNAAENMKAIAKGDSLLFICKLASTQRRFRMKLESREACVECVAKLQHFLPVRNADTDCEGLLTDSLPAAYRCDGASDDHVATVLKLCLTDSTFPAFVGRVDKELKNIMDE